MLRRIGPCTRAGLLLLILAACAVAVTPRAAAKQPPTLAQVPHGPPAQQTGRPLGRADWLDRLPLALACIAVVVVVDAVVVVRIVQKRRQGVTRPDRGPSV